MNIEFVGKELSLSEPFKDLVQRGVEKLESRLGMPIFARVTCVEAPNNQFSVLIHFTARHEYNATSIADDLHKAAHDALAKIGRQVSKHLEKSAAHRVETIRTEDIG